MRDRRRREQTRVTKDNKTVNVQAAIAHKVFDINLFLID